jgi:TonB family protein
LPEEARQNNVSGNVRIRFLVDKNGQPKDFLILKSLGFGCDEAARRIIEQYNWIYGQNNTLTVDIPFVR